MLEMTDGYKLAIVGDVRQMYAKAILEIIDPDIAYQFSDGSGAAAWSKSDQLHSGNPGASSRYSSLEGSRWILDGTVRAIPEDVTQLTGQIGHVGNVLSGDDGLFPETVYAELAFGGVDVLQACSIYFSNDAFDGIGVDFRVAIMRGEAEAFSQEFSGNTATKISLDGFTVYSPTAIRVYVTKWSLPSRYLRVMQIFPGLYEEWEADVLDSIDVQLRSNFSCLSIPYGVATVRIDNSKRRFEPRNRTGLFTSLEDRQGIPIAIGARLPDGSIEWKRVGVFYQHSGGWRTSDNALSLEWSLVDIIGLLSDREFVVPAELPTTLGGWLEALVSQLGANFSKFWHADPDYLDAEARVSAAEDVAGKKCGDILRFVCMATGTWARADAETGKLTAEPLWSEGNKYTLDNMDVYPAMRANDVLAALTFKLYDGADTMFTVSGNSTTSDKMLSVNNPFIHTEEQALTAARQILSQYGGLRIETTGRGNPASEIGDVDTVWLDKSTAATARRMEQSFTFADGVLQSCKSVLLQADGALMFRERTVLTGSGTWTAPAGISELHIILTGRGSDGAAGTDGTFDAPGVDGADGAGALVWAGTIAINEGQEFEYSCGEDAVFGSYSSAHGKRFEWGYTDVASGSSFARSGVVAPLDGSGDGGCGGKGGVQGIHHWEPRWLYPSGIRIEVEVVDRAPGKGTEGVPGALGSIVIYWDKEAGA